MYGHLEETRLSSDEVCRISSYTLCWLLNPEESGIGYGNQHLASLWFQVVAKPRVWVVSSTLPESIEVVGRRIDSILEGSVDHLHGTRTTQ